ncbi:MAG: hypothetical protein K9K66_04405 [Desulfarculaceae bacterium]|nr:hypothetical protein [Desulfarculaceae bacterium]MCF8073285.1 hypothetical protein [Desulfarculaceae bacterium]MCF8100881.1 hypothetical protein [Desulfarculaceae bacterium]MCF8116663.1 hypothetical protein [Desulfarculaceae bacterium]
MNFRVEELKAEHIVQIIEDQFPEFDEERAEGLVTHFLTVSSLGEGMAGVDVETGRAFYLAGIRNHWPGRAETFSLGGTGGVMEPYRGGITKACHEIIQGWAAKHGLHRMDAMIQAAAGESEHAFMRALGFRPESLKQAYGTQAEDWIEYVQFWGRGVRS